MSALFYFRIGDCLLLFDNCWFVSDNDVFVSFMVWLGKPEKSKKKLNFSTLSLSWLWLSRKRQMCKYILPCLFIVFLCIHVIYSHSNKSRCYQYKESYERCNITLLITFHWAVTMMSETLSTGWKIRKSGMFDDSFDNIWLFMSLVAFEVLKLFWAKLRSITPRVFDRACFSGTIV